ncbi:MAG: hypothetical protein AB8G18_09300 [Gammaproteobacteria bacterium]
MNDKTVSRWRKFAVEFIAITFGVVLGIWLSGLQEDRERAGMVDRMRASLLSELAVNFEEISSSRSYHLELIPGIINARNALAAGEDFQPVSYRGFGTVPNRTAAYETALATGIFADFSPEDSEEIINAYIAIEDLSKVQERYLLALTTIGSNSSRFFDLISYAFSDMLYGEDQVLTAIGLAIQKEAPPSWRTQTTPDPYSSD